jgi:hypothetical protein
MTDPAASDGRARVRQLVELLQALKETADAYLEADEAGKVESLDKLEGPTQALIIAAQELVLALDTLDAAALAPGRVDQEEVHPREMAADALVALVVDLCRQGAEEEAKQAVLAFADARRQPTRRESAMNSLADEFPRQQARVQAILSQYRQIGPAGAFGAAMIEDVLRRADKAAIDGEVVEMIRVLKEMQEITG